MKKLVDIYQKEIQTPTVVVDFPELNHLISRKKKIKIFFYLTVVILTFVLSKMIFDELVREKSPEVFVARHSLSIDLDPVPEEVKILINGKSINQKTDIVLTESAVPFNVIVKAPGYIPFNQDVEITESMVLKVELKPLTSFLKNQD